jgi:hypothetical protein
MDSFTFSNFPPHFPNFVPKKPIEIITLKHLVVINYELALYVFFPALLYFIFLRFLVAGHL